MEISKEKLSKIYHENKTYDACKILQVSLPTLMRYIKQAGIKPKGKGNRKRKLKIKD